MITCKEATYLISKREQDVLSFAERLQLKFHLMMCKYCRRFAEQVHFLNDAILKMKQKVEDQEDGIQLSKQSKDLLRSKIAEAQN
ncbi:zf-HC2 domain-containing protein [Carboxylicivirga sp. M1479]|nr:zf-HC2 domain-containing protein [Carboxylicivirga sp. M1479]